MECNKYDDDDDDDDLTHNGSASVRIMVQCFVLVKMYWHRPRKFLNRVKENSKINMKALLFHLLGVL
jgi:hypothetical protein